MIPKPEKQPSKSQQLRLEYYRIRREWIKGKKCAVRPGYPADDVHHMKGRTGYADAWARENDVPLLIDTRFWLPVSRKAHIEIGNNPNWAYEKGYSLKRNESPTTD